MYWSARACLAPTLRADHPLVPNLAFCFFVGEQVSPPASYLLDGVRGGLFFPNLEGYVTKFEPHKALKLIARGKLTLDGRVVLHRAVL